MSDAVVFDYSVERKGSACFALAPTAMAALYNKWLSFYAVAYQFAAAAAFEGKSTSQGL